MRCKRTFIVLSFGGRGNTDAERSVSTVISFVIYSFYESTLKFCKTIYFETKIIIIFVKKYLNTKNASDKTLT